MAKSVNTTINYGRNSKGKLIKTKKVVRTASNTQKGANTPNLSKNQLKAMQIKADKDIKLANIATKSANIANVTSQAASTIKQSVGGSSPIVSNGDKGVLQNVIGGLSESSSSRDDDDNPYIA